MDTIYLDNAATTQMCPEVLQSMLPYFREEYGNPSSIYDLGQHASDAVSQSRSIIANAIGANDNEIYFTASGTEADNWAIKGFARVNARKGKHIITSAIEHHAILNSCKALEKEGYEITYLPVNSDGFVSVRDFEAAIRPDTILATIMFANNEIGTIQPIRELATCAHARGVAFHTDAVQAFGHEPIDVRDLGIDMMSASAHKLYGPKGVGFLYIRKGLSVSNLIDGGQQERGKRAATENVPGIVGFGEAVRLCMKEREGEYKRQSKLRDHAISRLLTEIPYSRLNGSATQRLANNINISFEFIEGEGIILQMGMRGICISSGSACTSGSLDPSHVLLAIGLPHEIAHGSMRMTLGRGTTTEQVDYAIDNAIKAINNLRAMSPLYEDSQHGKAQSWIEAHQKCTPNENEVA